MKRLLFFTYGVVGHLLFLVTYAWLGAFVCNLYLTHTIDRPAGAPLASSIVIDLLLVGAFALQHSVMARPAFKAVWTRIVPKPIERSTYVYASCLVVALLIVAWRPIDLVVWQAPAGLWSGLLSGLCVIGWFMVPTVSLMIDHFDLFGTRQVWIHLCGREYDALPFHTPMLYRFIRHPLYVGWAIAFWATPTMTLGHLVFAASMTVYMVLASLVEERDLVAYFGRAYEEYQRRVPRFVPRFTPGARSEAEVARVELLEKRVAG